MSIRETTLHGCFEIHPTSLGAGGLSIFLYGTGGRRDYCGLGLLMASGSMTVMAASFANGGRRGFRVVVYCNSEMVVLFS